MRVEDSFREILEAQTYWFPVFGTFVSFDPTKRTGIITPAFMYKGMPAPQLQDVKVLLPGGGGWTVNLKPTAGDFALILFCGAPTADFWDRNLPGNYDNANPSDAVAIPFAKDAILTSGLSVSNGITTFEVTESDVTLTLLGGVMYSLVNHTHSSPAGGNTGPANPVP